MTTLYALIAMLLLTMISTVLAADPAEDKRRDDAIRRASESVSL